MMRFFLPAPLCVAALTAQAQIEIINVLGPGTMNMSCWEGEAQAAFTPGNLQQIEPGETAQVQWVGAGQLDPVTGLPLVRPGTSGPSLVVGDFTGVKTRCAAAVVDVNVGGPNEALVVWLAPVIQDPSDHADFQKPSIWSQLLDANNQPLPCSGFQVNSASRDGWQNVPGTPDVYYRPWFPNIVPLRGYEGQLLRLQLATTDCLKNAHYGYCAVQTFHVALTIDVKEDACSGGFTLTAPPGAWTYNWTNDAGGGPWQGESIVTTMPGTYTVVMRTPSGCDYDMSVVVPAMKKLPTVGEVKVGGALDCTTPGVELVAPKMENVAGYSWSMKGSSDVLGTEEKFTARTKGDYVLVMTSSEGEGCNQTREATVLSKMNLPIPEFGVSAADICVGDSVSFEVITPAKAAKGKVEELWNFGDGTTGTKPTTRAYNVPGIVTIDRMFTLGTCEEHFTQTVNVHPLPAPRMRVITHCGPARWQRTYEFEITGVAASPTSIVFTLNGSDGRPYLQQRNGVNIVAVVPGDTSVSLHIEVVDALGCFGAHDTVWKAPFDPVADFVPVRNAGVYDYTFDIEDSSAHVEKRHWTAVRGTMGMDSTTVALRTVEYPGPGDYVIRLEVYGVHNTCPDAKEDVIQIAVPLHARWIEPAPQPDRLPVIGLPATSCCDRTPHPTCPCPCCKKSFQPKNTTQRP